MPVWASQLLSGALAAATALTAGPQLLQVSALDCFFLVLVLFWRGLLGFFLLS